MASVGREGVSVNDKTVLVLVAGVGLVGYLALRKAGSLAQDAAGAIGQGFNDAASATTRIVQDGAQDAFVPSFHVPTSPMDPARIHVPTVLPGAPILNSFSDGVFTATADYAKKADANPYEARMALSRVPEARIPFLPPNVAAALPVFNIAQRGLDATNGAIDSERRRLAAIEAERHTLQKLKKSPGFFSGL